MLSSDGDNITKKAGADPPHAEEFNRFREDAAKNSLRKVLKSEGSVSDGFLINSNYGISTQCDIIIYNANNEPICYDSIVIMFPVEDLRAIFEIESTLTRQI